MADASAVWLCGPDLRLLAAHRFQLDHFNKPSAIKENQRKTSTETRRNTTHARDTGKRDARQTQETETGNEDQGQVGYGQTGTGKQHGHRIRANKT